MDRPSRVRMGFGLALILAAPGCHNNLRSEVPPGRPPGGGAAMTPPVEFGSASPPPQSFAQPGSPNNPARPMGPGGAGTGTTNPFAAPTQPPGSSTFSNATERTSAPGRPAARPAAGAGSGIDLGSPPTTEPEMPPIINGTD